MVNDKIEWLKEQCNFYANGTCYTLSCLNRGGYKRGEIPVKYDIATCIVKEIVNDLNELKELQKSKHQDELYKKLAKS